MIFETDHAAGETFEQTMPHAERDLTARKTDLVQLTHQCTTVLSLHEADGCGVC